MHLKSELLVDACDALVTCLIKFDWTDLCESSLSLDDTKDSYNNVALPKLR